MVRLINEHTQFNESREDQQKFIDKFGEESFADFQKFKQVIKNKGYSPDLTFHVKNTSLDDMEKILDDVSDVSREQEFVVDDNGTFIQYNGTEETVIIPDSVTSISSDAFFGYTSFTSVTIPYSVKRIGPSTFKNCTSLESITVDSENSYYSSLDGVLFNKDKTKLIRYPRGKTATRYSIPNSVTDIGDSAFKHCKSLKSVAIPDSVTIIRDDAFYNCTSLESITIPDSVTSICRSAFQFCTSLKSVIIGNSVTRIGWHAFEGCASLTSITIPDSVTTIGEYTFTNCKSLKSIIIPDSVTSIGKGAFAYCDSLIVYTNNDYVIDYCKENDIKYDTNVKESINKNTFKLRIKEE